MGVGSDNAGTHPSRVTTGGNATLTQTGELCNNCDTVIIGDHGCHAEEHVDEGETMSQEEIIELLGERHYSGKDALVECIEDGHVHLEPTLFAVTLPNPSTAVVDGMIVDAVREVAEDEDKSGGWAPDDIASNGHVYSHIGAETDPEKAFIKKRMQSLRGSALVGTKYGWKVS